MHLKIVIIFSLLRFLQVLNIWGVVFLMGVTI